ncbi:glycosyltransferase family 4 protein [Streptosporangium sp. NPDC000396]|uniref:glycosyltransferase family 4 protein n=1 Tax=Streptosporangium sp. NPDC000396 TaxID=3366185 RepID=UPI0036AA5CF1
MTAITGVDLPVGSPGGSVELLKDLYLAPGRPVPADVFMLAAHEGPPDTDRPALLKVDGKCLDGQGFWRYVADLTAAIRHRFAPEDYGILHLQHLAFGATPALLRAFPRHPSLAFVHGTDLLFAVDNPTQREVLGEAAAAADVVVAPTTAMIDLLLAIAPVQPRRVAHIPWGVPDQLLSEPTVRHRRAGEELRILYAGRLTAEKGVESLLDAVVRLDGVTIGVAAPEIEYRAMGGRVDLSAVRYLGWLDRRELWRAFGDHDLLIVPSTRLEAFGLVAVEAQACGLPVIYQPVPGLVEVLGDSALRVDLSAPRELADVIAWLAKDPGALEDIRTGGRRNALRFPLSNTIRDINSLSMELQR